MVVIGCSVTLPVRKVVAVRKDRPQTLDVSLVRSSVGIQSRKILDRRFLRGGRFRGSHILLGYSRRQFGFMCVATFDLVIECRQVILHLAKNTIAATKG